MAVRSVETQHEGAVGSRIRYMGNKRELADSVGDLCECLPRDEPLVDLFGGMCNVAGAVASSARAVEVNDIQQYAELVARCLIGSRQGPPLPSRVAASLRADFDLNAEGLRARFARELRAESKAIRAADAGTLRSCEERWRHVGNDAEMASEAAGLRKHPNSPYRLCTLTFAWSYFGLLQSIELDSIRFAIDRGTDQGFDPTAQRWMRMALLQSASRVASTPGHFAQYLKANDDVAAKRIAAYRRRPVWNTFLEDLGTLRPYGTTRWRRLNRVHREEACRLVESKASSAIYYADPPYSKEHYSRFYHVLETLERYDYPTADGAGRYRPDRFHSDFAKASRVVEACERLFAAIAARGGTLLFSYPSSGLLSEKRGIATADLLGGHFRHVRLAINRRAQHSTLGARHGRATKPVYEQVWLASGSNRQTNV